MKKHEADALIQTIRGFVEGGQPAQEAVTQAVGEVPKPANGEVKARVVVPTSGRDPNDFEALYQAIKRRFIAEAQVDPILLNLMMVQPEIVVDVERQVMQVDGASLKGRIASLIAEGFLKEPKRASELNKRLNATGGMVNSGSLSNALSAIKIDGFLVQDGDGWQAAPGVKVTKNRIET